MEHRLIAILVRLCRWIGLCNLRYVPEQRRFELEHGVILIYWVLLDVVYLLLTPCVFVVMVHSFFRCQDMHMLAVAYSVVALAKVLSMFSLLYTIWRRRRRMQYLGNGFLVLLHRYRTHQSSFRYWRPHLGKLLLCNTRFAVLILLLFGPDSAFMCRNIIGEMTEVPPLHIFFAFEALLMELVVSCSDHSIYFLVATSNWLLECMSKEANELTQDVRWFPQSYGSHRSVYQQQIFAAWRRLWRCCRRLDTLFIELVDIFQWQILLNLFTCYLTDITLLFNFVVLFNESDMTLWLSLSYFFLCISYHWDIMTYFTIFEVNNVQWIGLLTRLQKLWFIVRSSHIDPNQDIPSLWLIRQLELALIFLNRKLQQRPERIRRPQIVGLFVMSRESGKKLTSSIAINVLILCQIAYKNYYRPKVIPNLNF